MSAGIPIASPFWALPADRQLIMDYEALFEPITGPICAALLEFAGAPGPGERVIEFAAGSGALSLMLARTGAALVATDIVPAATARVDERLAAEGLSARVEVQDLQRIDMTDGNFDAAFCSLGLMLIPDYRTALRELEAILRPGGRVALSVWAHPKGSPVGQRVREAFATVFPDRAPPPTPSGMEALSSRHGLTNELRRAGFEQVRVRSATTSWPLPEPDWLVANADRLFQVQPGWQELDRADRKRLIAALLDQLAKGARHVPARAWLATARTCRTGTNGRKKARTVA